MLQRFIDEEKTSHVAPPQHQVPQEFVAGVLVILAMVDTRELGPTAISGEQTIATIKSATKLIAS